MLASGTTGTIATESEALMQDYKAGDMIGSSPKHLTIMQLIATPVGAAAVSWMYPLLRRTYGIVGEHAGLTSPISRKWAAFAEVLSRGFSALPRGAVPALVIVIARRNRHHDLRDARREMVAIAHRHRHRDARSSVGHHRDVRRRIADLIWRRVDRRSNQQLHDAPRLRAHRR